MSEKETKFFILEVLDEIRIFKISKQPPRIMTSFSTKAQSTMEHHNHASANNHIKRPMNAFMVILFLKIFNKLNSCNLKNIQLGLESWTAKKNGNRKS